MNYCEAFRAIQFKGTYGVTEAIEIYKLPRINVKGVGRLSFPISECHIIDKIEIKKCYGKTI